MLRPHHFEHGYLLLCMKSCDHCTMTPVPRALSDDQSRYPGWFLAFLADRAVRKPSPHTVKAYRQDFVAIATQLAGAPDRVVHLASDAITRDAMQACLRRLCPHPRGRINPAMLVKLEHAVRLPLHGRTHHRQPDAASRPAQSHQDTPEGSASACSSAPKSKDPIEPT